MNYPIITGPGYYKQQDGRKAEVFAIHGIYAIGVDALGDGAAWELKYGMYLHKYTSPQSLVGPWTEPALPENAA